jgi:hypothetical protein
VKDDNSSEAENKSKSHIVALAYCFEQGTRLWDGEAKSNQRLPESLTGGDEPENPEGTS